MMNTRTTARRRKTAAYQKPEAVHEAALLKEDGDYLLLETGDKILLE
jgi:formate dehydrogenase assembly factor FdhD